LVYSFSIVSVFVPFPGNEATVFPPIPMSRTPVIGFVSTKERLKSTDPSELLIT